MVRRSASVLLVASKRRNCDWFRPIPHVPDNEKRMKSLRRRTCFRGHFRQLSLQKKKRNIFDFCVWSLLRSNYYTFLLVPLDVLTTRSNVSATAVAYSAFMTFFMHKYMPWYIIHPERRRKWQEIFFEVRNLDSARINVQQLSRCCMFSMNVNNVTVGSKYSWFVMKNISPLMHHLSFIDERGSISVFSKKKAK